MSQARSIRFPISRTINTELALADLAAVEKAYSATAKWQRRRRQGSAAHVAVLDKIRPVLDERARAERAAVEGRASGAETMFLLTAKPAMYVANVSERGFTGNPLLAKSGIREARRRAGGAISAAIERRWRSFGRGQAGVSRHGMKEPARRLIRAATRYWPADLFHAGRRKCAPGPCKSAQPRPRPRA